MHAHSVTIVPRHLKCQSLSYRVCGKVQLPLTPDAVLQAQQMGTEWCGSGIGMEVLRRGRSLKNEGFEA